MVPDLSLTLTEIFAPASCNCPIPISGLDVFTRVRASKAKWVAHELFSGVRELQKKGLCLKTLIPNIRYQFLNQRPVYL